MPLFDTLNFVYQVADKVLSAVVFTYSFKQNSEALQSKYQSVAKEALYLKPSCTCADPGIFVREGPGQSEKKSSNNVFFFFFFFFLVLSLFYRSQTVNFKEINHFLRFQRGSNIFQGGGGGPTFSRGSNCLFPIET